MGILVQKKQQMVMKAIHCGDSPLPPFTFVQRPHLSRDPKHQSKADKLRILDLCGGRVQSDKDLPW